MVKYHDLEISPTAKGVRRAIVKVGEELFPYLLEVKRADFLAQSMYKREQKEEKLAIWKRLYEEILEKKECVSIKDLAVNGSDLIAAGMKPGKGIGEALQNMLEMVLENPSLNTKEFLLSEISHTD